MAFRLRSERVRTRIGHRFARAIAGVALASLATSAGANDDALWERTETRADCTHFDPLRQPFFGDTHVHTLHSADATLNGMQAGPDEAYQFARGAALPLTPQNPIADIQLRRPIDFAMVSDHAEQLGELHICLTPGLQGYDSLQCATFRAGIGTAESFNSPGFIQWALPLLGDSPSRFDWCADATTPDGNCLQFAPIAWQDIQDAAEAHYDRTDACTFTTFVGYEWTGMTNLSSLHRNIVFRNATVPTLPASYIDTPSPVQLWDALDLDCRETGTGCDALIIPHNSNLGNGGMFNPEFAVEYGNTVPITADEARRRALMEPVVELTQHKADSECNPMFSPDDELCDFEQVEIGGLADFMLLDETHRSNFVRNALMDGLEREEQLGANPFRFGLIGSTDTHLATSGATREDDFPGHVGSIDDLPEDRIGRTGPFGNGATPGGLAVLWAEENSRDALFAAMQRREVYSTSGTRPLVRFFAGNLDNDACSSGLVEQGYASGVPMGGVIGGPKRPRFAVWAQKDPGAPDLPGTPLQRIQIIKGWVDGFGAAQERVYEVAGDPDNGAGVDVATCTPTGSGSNSLCSVWRDPDFKPEQRAFYYARVVENPSCRWSQHACNAENVDCSDLASVPADFLPCCDGSIPATIQERAVTSPIFYRPEALSLALGRLIYREPGKDKLKLSARILANAPAFDPTVDAVEVTVRDRDEIYSVTVPAGSWSVNGSSFVYKDKQASLNGLRMLKIRRVGKLGGMALKLLAEGQDWTAVAPTGRTPEEQMVEVEVAIGDHRDAVARRWQVSKAGHLQGRP